MNQKEFKDLTFYKLNWEESGYVETITIGRKNTNSLTMECCKIVNDLLDLYEVYKDINESSEINSLMSKSLKIKGSSNL